MSAPRTSPEQRRVAEISAPETYRPGQPVWVFRGSWCPGIVVGGSSRALTIRYTPAGGHGTGVDTAFPADVATRDEPHPATDA
jgi:hypothetical protein